MGKWGMVRLGEVCDVISGSTPSTLDSDLWDGDVKWIAPAEIGEDSYYIYDTSKHISKKAGLKPMPIGTVLLSSRAPIGKVAITGSEMCCNQGFKNLVCSDRVHNRYLYRLLKSKTDYLNSLGRGATFKEISKSIVEHIEIPLPPFLIQQKIADVLDKASALIELRKAQIEKLDLLIKSQFIEMFGDPVTNPKGWERRTLKSICSKLTDGTHFSPESFQQGDYMYITAKNIKLGGFDLSNITYVNSMVHVQIYSRCNPEYGDVLYIKDGVTTGIAMVNYLSTPFTMLSSVALLKQNRSIITGEYLCNLLNNESMYLSIRGNMGGAAITRLTIDKLNKIVIPVPSIQLQQEFSNIALDLVKKKAMLHESIRRMELSYKSLIQKCFSGEMF